jgi:hypothetical protein
MKAVPCEERDTLFQLFLETLEVQGKAVRARPGREGEAFERLTALAGSARKTSEDCLDVFMAHERAHGCADRMAATPSAASLPTPQECAERRLLARKMAEAINAVYALRDQENDHKKDLSLTFQLHQATTARRVAEHALVDHIAEHRCMAAKG